MDKISYILFFSAFVFLFYYFNKKIQKIILILEQLSKNKASDDEYKKTTSDVKTLFDNQRMLLSLMNSLRGRINNLYGKKEKIKSKLREPGSNIPDGDEDDI